MENLPINQLLTGENAFYNQENYLEVTAEEMASSYPMETPSYTCNIENKVWRIVKDIFSVIIFPIGLYRLTHRLVGRIIVPATNYDSFDANFFRTDLNPDDEWKYKRISVQVDGYTIDATIMGKVNTLGNERWVLASNGNNELYENKFQNHEFKQIVSELKGNAIVFNYPGVGSSSGMPSRSAMSKAYRAMLNFLEDEKNGIGAKEIIGYGHSIGGGVQGEALRSHKLKEDVDYVFVKSRTFNDLSTTASYLSNRLLGFLVKVLGWNMGSVKSSKNLQAPEIIMQTAEVTEYTDISDNPELIIGDGVIPKKASLAKKLLEDTNCNKDNKYFMGIPEKHNQKLNNPSHLVKKINAMIKVTP